MVAFCYRMKDGEEWKTFTSEKRWKSVADALKEMSKNQDMCDWLLEEHTYVYFKEVSDNGTTRKCPM